MDGEEGVEEEGVVLEDWRSGERKKEVRFRNSFDWSSDEDERAVRRNKDEDEDGSDGSELGLGKYFWENGVGIRRW